MNIETIWSEYRTKVKRFLHKKVSDPDEVDDLLQEILISTYQNLHTLRSDQHINAWLFQIARHAIIDFYRRQGRHTLPEGEALWYQDDAPDIQQALSQCIAPFITAPPEESARLLYETDLMGVSQKDYAAQHNLNYSTLKSRVQKARQALRGVFEDCCQISMDKQGNVAGCEQKDQFRSC